MTVSFDGTQYLSILPPNGTLTEVEDISLRFRTRRPDGLLVGSTSNSSTDRLELMLSEGQVRLDLRLGSGTKALYTGSGLDDNKWHSVHVRRRGRDVELRVDNETAVQDRLSSAQESVLHWGKIVVASLSNSPPEELLKEDGKAVDVDMLHLVRRPGREARSAVRSRTNFVGQMQSFMFNGDDIFDMIRTRKIRNVMTNTRFTEPTSHVDSPVTFLRPAAFFTTRLRLYDTFTIYFAMKTTQPDGLIMFSGNSVGGDFMAIELHNGHLRYIFDVGSGPRVVRSRYRGPLNDNEWHHVTILRPHVNQHIVRVDDSSDFDHLPDTSSVHFDMTNDLYVGGITRSMFSALPKQVKSRLGFQGCLGSLDLDGESRNIRPEIPPQFRTDIFERCEGPTDECSPESCENGGKCIQEWHTFRCDCDLTSFTGPTCSHDGMAYTFSGEGGLITYHFPPEDQPDTNKDTLSLGFITTQSDAVLIRIESELSNDYIELELDEGRVLVVYNMGTMDHPITELFARVNDGSYHTVRFSREGPNATLQVDSHNPQTKHPTGRHMTIFNDQARVLVGGRLTPSDRLTRPFKGTIAGVVLNGQHILEAAVIGDPLVTIEGDVELEIKSLRTRYSLTPLAPTPPHIGQPGPDEASTPGMLSTMAQRASNGDGDDIVFTSGCHYEDEEECTQAGSGASSTDSLITPVLEILTTTHPSESSRTPTTQGLISSAPSDVVHEGSGDSCEDDDEDCETVDPASGGDHSHGEASTEDIGFSEVPTDGSETGSNLGSNSTENVVVIDVDMTETPSKKKPTVFTEESVTTDDEDITEAAPVRKQTESPSSSTTIHAQPSSVGSGKPGKTGSRGQGHSSLGMNIGLIVGIVAGVMVLLLIFAYLCYKYRSRDEGSYKIDETKNYSYETCNTKPSPQINGGTAKSKGHSSTKPRKKDIKEWYV